MKRITKVIVVALFAGMFIVSCSDDSSTDPGPNPPPPPPPPGSEITITSVGPSELFWGDEITITGTGFSAVKEQNIVKFTNVDPDVPPVLKCQLNYTSAQGDIEIITASPTQLKIKVPVKLNIMDEPYCGPRKADIEVAVGSSVAKSTGLEFGPLPYISGFLYHYGWFDVPSVTRIADSVMIGGGLLYTPKNGSKYWDKLRLSIDDMNIPIKYRTIGLESGWSFYLPVEDFAEINCSEEPDGWGAREMKFTFSIEGTNKSASRMLYVQYLPPQSSSCDLCPSPLSKLAGGNPEWVIKGQNMNYSEVRFSPIAPCGGATQGMGINASEWTNEIRFSVPLSILASDCAYGVYLTNECQSTFIGNIGINP